MAFTWEFGKQFTIEFKNYPSDQQDAILRFTEIFEEHGLSDFSKFDGKISPSWKGVEPSNQAHKFALSNNLWHYHVGIPNYRPSIYGSYLTSDWVLHFQWDNWKNKGTHIVLVDILFHYHKDGQFHLPSEKYLLGKDK